jgi:hypothetical protein
VPDSNLVAIVGVGAGALVALAAPTITARATTRGQRRLFEHQRNLADRRELREVLDHTIEAIAEMERPLGALHLAYVSGDYAGVVEDSLGPADEAVRRLELCCARIAIRLGNEAAAYLACNEVRSLAEAIVSKINRHLTLPDISPSPSSRALQGEMDEIREATSRFIAEAETLVGSHVIAGHGSQHGLT